MLITSKKILLPAGVKTNRHPINSNTQLVLKDTGKVCVCHGGPSPQYQRLHCSALHHSHLWTVAETMATAVVQTDLFLGQVAP